MLRRGATRDGIQGVGSEPTIKWDWTIDPGVCWEANARPGQTPIRSILSVASFSRLRSEKLCREANVKRHSSSIFAGCQTTA